MYYKYRIFCTTDQKYEFVISDILPQECPVNPAHDVDLDSIVIIQEIEELDGSLISLTLDDQKYLKNRAIDKRTRELIGAGFVYNNITFSASETAQRNWLAIDQLKDELTYPFGVSTKDDSEYLIQDAIEAHLFVLVGLGTIEPHYASGRALKQLVKAAQDQAELDAIVDNR